MRSACGAVAPALTVIGAFGARRPMLLVRTRFPSRDVVAAKPGTSIAEMARWLPTTAQGTASVARLEAENASLRRVQLARLGYGGEPVTQHDLLDCCLIRRPACCLGEVGNLVEELGTEHAGGVDGKK